jgi:hypothetical protein
MGCAITHEPLDDYGVSHPVAAARLMYVPVLNVWPSQDSGWPNLSDPFEAFQRVLKNDPFFLEFEGGGVWMDMLDSLEQGAKGGASLWRAGVGVRLQKRASALFGWGSIRDGLHGQAVDTGAFVTVSMDFRF